MSGPKESWEVFLSTCSSLYFSPTLNLPRPKASLSPASLPMLTCLFGQVVPWSSVLGLLVYAKIHLPSPLFSLSSLSLLPLSLPAIFSLLLSLPPLNPSWCLCLFSLPLTYNKILLLNHTSERSCPCPHFHSVSKGLSPPNSHFPS